MNRVIRLSLVALTLFASAQACSKSSPSSPSSPTSATTVTVGTYVGNLNVSGNGGLGGMLLLSKGSGSMFANRMSVPRTLLEFVQPTLHAQSSAASGTLVTNAGPAVPLTGTFGASMFTMAGGGYSITGTVNGTSVTGSGTAPGGVAAQVTAVPPPAGSAPSPSAEGTYTSSFQIDSPHKFVIVRNSSGALDANCTQNMSIGGNISIRLSRENGVYTGFMLVTWTEQGTGPTTGYGCPPLPLYNFGPYGVNYAGPLETLVFATHEVSTTNGLTTVRTQAFVGALTGTTVQGQYWKSQSVTGPVGTLGQTLTSGYANMSATVTLTK